MILLDTTILSYVVGDEHPLRDPCARILEAHRAGAVAATTTIEAIREFAHVRARRRGRADAAEWAREFMQALPLLSTDLADLDLGVTLFERHARLGSFDALLAAVAINRQADALVSADRAFDLVPDLRWVDPSSPALDELIAG